jgi:hypothetical protein
MNRRTLLWFLGALAGGLLILMAWPETSSPMGGHSPSAETTVPNRDGRASSVADFSGGQAVTLTRQTSGDADDRSAGAVDAPATSGEQLWKERLAALLTSESHDDRELGRQLLGIAATEDAPGKTRASAMANALNFADDASYPEDVMPVALRPDLPEVVHDVILEDLLARDPRMTAPVARRIAAVPGHPLAGALTGFLESLRERRDERTR